MVYSDKIRDLETIKVFLLQPIECMWRRIGYLKTSSDGRAGKRQKWEFNEVRTVEY